MYKKLDIYKTLHQWKTCTENITCGYFKVLKQKNNFFNQENNWSAWEKTIFYIFITNIQASMTIQIIQWNIGCKDLD